MPALSDKLHLRQRLRQLAKRLCWAKMTLRNLEKGLRIAAIFLSTRRKPTNLRLLTCSSVN